MIHYFFHAHHPPRIKLTSDLDFVLRVAVGTSCGNFGHPSSSRGAWQWAERLHLEERVASVLSQAGNVDAWGPELSAGVRRVESRRQGNLRACAEVRERLERALAEGAWQVVSLPDSANYGDSALRTDDANVEVLVDGEGYRPLIGELVRGGCVTELLPVPWSARKGRGLVIRGRQGAGLVLHRELRFVRMVPGGAFVDLDCLKRCGQLSRDAVAPKNIWLASIAVQAANVVAELLVEQRFAPEFPAFRGLLAAQTLGLGHDEDIAFDAYLLLHTDVEHAEYEALRELLRALTGGTLHELSKRARTLLDHFVASASAPNYRARLQLQRKAQVWQHDGHLERAAEGVGRLLAMVTNR